MSNKKYIQISIDGDFLDFKEDNLNLQLTFKNPCSGGFGTILGNSSERSQTLPATKQNDEVFSNWWNVKQDNTTTGPIEKDCEILVNGLNVFSGKAQMKKVTTLGRVYEVQGDEYNVAFFSSNADWFNDLKGKELGRDLDWSNELHNYTRTNVTNGFNADPTLVNYCYFVPKLRDWAEDTTSGYVVDVFQCMPAIFIKQILDKIFNSIGYTITSNNFFDNSVNNRYVLPVIFPEKYPQAFSEDYLNVAATKSVLQNVTDALFIGIPYDTQTKTPPVSNPLTSLSTPSTVVIGAGNLLQYTVPYDGYYQVTMSVTVDNISGTVSFNYGVLGGGFSTTFGTGQTLTPADNGNTYTKVTLAQMEVGQVIETYCSLGPALATLDITAATFDVIGEASITPNGPVDFKYLLREWKVTDFLKGLTAAFNLCWETDPNLKTIDVLPSDDYLLTDRAGATSSIQTGFHQETTTDTTPKQDLSKKGSVTNMNQTQETQYYKWKTDSADATAQGLNLNEDIEIGGCKYDMPSDRFKPGTKQNENPFFSPTVMFYDEDIRSTSSELVPLLPLFWPHDIRDNTNNDDVFENLTEFAPRLLWFGGARLGDIDGKFKYYDTSTGTLISANQVFPACFFVNYNDSTGLDVSLSYSDRTIQGNLVQGQLRRFYLAHLSRLRHGKKVEMFIYWDELDILQLSFQNKVLINGDMYILEEINSFDPIIDSTTKTVLLYDFGAEQEDINAISNSIALGVLGGYLDPE